MHTIRIMWIGRRYYRGLDLYINLHAVSIHIKRRLPNGTLCMDHRLRHRRPKVTH